MVSIIVCTYRRAEALGKLLGSFAAQTYRSCEVLVVDGSGGDPSVRKRIETVRRSNSGFDIKLIGTAKGLTRQRNAGLNAALGDIIVFLDDDVTVGPTFLEQVSGLFARPAMQDVGGLTAYDVINYPRPITWRWRLRRWLGTVPSLVPGAADRLGRHAPLSFAEPSPACRPVGWLPGFCMIYRRAAIGRLRFDEQLPTYAGEDRDFSMRVAEHWRLVLCGSLLVQHHCSRLARCSAPRRVFETGFGSGRGFAKRMTGITDYFALVHYAGSELLIDMLAFVLRPSGGRFRAAFARLRGFVAGVRSGARERDGLRGSEAFARRWLGRRRRTRAGGDAPS